MGRDLKPFPERWWYTAPWKRSRPFRFVIRVFRDGGDEFCNPTIWIGLPLLGAITIRYRRGPIRTYACDTCQRTDGPWCEGCQSCHPGPRCHDWGCCPHNVRTEDCLQCGGMYCPLCEPEPASNCLEQP